MARVCTGNIMKIINMESIGSWRKIKKAMCIWYITVSYCFLHTYTLVKPKFHTCIKPMDPLSWYVSEKQRVIRIESLLFLIILKSHVAGYLKSHATREWLYKHRFSPQRVFIGFHQKGVKGWDTDPFSIFPLEGTTAVTLRLPPQ